MRKGIIGRIRRSGSLLLAVIFIMTVFTGCSKNETASVEGKKLTVYYVKGTSYYSTALKEYDVLDSNVTFECVEFETEDEMKDKLATAMAEGKGPDVILLSDTTTLDVYKSIKGENFADLSSYFSKDSDYVADEYFKGVMDGVKVDGKQYIVPLMFDLNIYCMKKSVMDSLNITDLGSKSGFGEFMNAVSGYQNAIQAKSNTALSLRAVSTKKRLDGELAAIRACGLQAVDYSGKICLSKTDFKAAFSVIKAMYDEKQNKKSTLETTSTVKDLFGKADSFFYNGNLPMGISVINGVLSAQDQSFVISGIPNVNANTGYNANLVNYGVVSSTSDNVEEGYKLLRYLMEYNSSSSKSTEMLGLPIKKKLYEKTYIQLPNTNATVQASSTEQIKLVPWNTDLQASYNNIIDNITSTSLPNSKVESIITEAMQGYLKGTEGFDSCYDKMLSQLKLYLQE